MLKVLILIPQIDFDPTEVAVPWKVLTGSGFEIQFSTPQGQVGKCDERMLSGKGLGVWAPSLRAASSAVQAYREMTASEEFLHPLPYDKIDFGRFDGLILPGGHAPGMKEYLESPRLQKGIAQIFQLGKPVGAICHGVVLAARSIGTDGKSILHDRKVTALPQWMELSAWAMTCLWLGSYYRTYPMTVEDEVKSVLKDPSAFDRGLLSTRRDSEDNPGLGFFIRDRNLVTARWPGDAHRFSLEFKKLFSL